MQRTEDTLFLDQRSENVDVIWSRYTVAHAPAEGESVPKWWMVTKEYELPYGLGVRTQRHTVCGTKQRALEVLDEIAEDATRLRDAREAQDTAQWADVAAGEQHLSDTEPK
jgi:hypothetical protein